MVQNTFRVAEAVAVAVDAIAVEVRVVISVAGCGVASLGRADDHVYDAANAVGLMIDQCIAVRLEEKYHSLRMADTCKVRPGTEACDDRIRENNDDLRFDEDSDGIGNATDWAGVQDWERNHR